MDKQQTFLSHLLGLLQFKHENGFDTSDLLEKLNQLSVIG